VENVLSFVEARNLVEQHAAELRASGTERVSLLEASGRVLAQSLVCDRDQPPFDRSTRDGFAVHAADLANVPAQLKVVGEVRAGATWSSPLNRGEALEIMTGAGLPQGADAVVMVEFSERDGDQVVITRSVQPGENLVPRGAEARAGQRLLAPGTRINHAVIALAASLGSDMLEVSLRPVVSVIATGDELVGIMEAPGPAQIRDSNSYSVSAQVQYAGGEVRFRSTALDELDRLRATIGTGLNAHLLLLTGGVSMGKYDLVEQVLREFNAEFLFTGVKIQPGKPLVFGRIPLAQGFTYFFGLPGNPVSTMVTFALFVEPMLRSLSGETATPLRFLRAKLKSAVRSKTGLTRFLPARLSGALEQTEVELIPWQGSGDIASTTLADCLLVVPPDRDQIPADEWVSVVLI
jgi:molybdopterin molybdotransferase